MVKKINEDFYKLIPIKSRYIKPNEDLKELYEKTAPFLKEGDYLVIAETPISISKGRLIDESEYKSSIRSIFLADIWSKYLWGYILGPILGIKKRTIKNLRKLPKETRRHKEAVLKNYGWKHALKPASEAGIDLSNVPGTLVSMIPENCNDIAEDIAKKFYKMTLQHVTVIIMDTDATYKFRNKYFTGLPEAINGISPNHGVFGYFFGQLSENLGSTPLGCSRRINVNEALAITNLCEDYQKKENNIETVYRMKSKLKKEIDDITIEDLDSIEHTPIIIVREK